MASHFGIFRSIVEKLNMASHFGIFRSIVEKLNVASHFGTISGASHRTNESSLTPGVRWARSLQGQQTMEFIMSPAAMGGVIFWMI